MKIIHPLVMHYRTHKW